jgi:hypothetical protein
VVEATSPSNSGEKTHAVSCRDGKKALGGGGSIAGGGTQNSAIQASRPIGGSPPTGWSVTGINTNLLGAGNWSLTAYVICATVP